MQRLKLPIVPTEMVVGDNNDGPLSGAHNDIWVRLGSATVGTSLLPRTFTLSGTILRRNGGGQTMTMTREEVISVLGPVDDETVAEIVSTGASLLELREAWAWAHGDEAL